MTLEPTAPHCTNLHVPEFRWDYSIVPYPVSLRSDLSGTLVNPLVTVSGPSSTTTGPTSSIVTPVTLRFPKPSRLLCPDYSEPLTVLHPLLDVSILRSKGGQGGSVLFGFSTLSFMLVSKPVKAPPFTTGESLVSTSSSKGHLSRNSSTHCPYLR